MTMRELVTCSACSMANYCSQECQVLHWKSGVHKQQCTARADADAPGHGQGMLKHLIGSRVNFMNRGMLTRPISYVATGDKGKKYGDEHFLDELVKSMVFRHLPSLQAQLTLQRAQELE